MSIPMTRKTDTMMTIFQPTRLGHAAWPPAGALSGLCLAMGVTLLAGCAAERPLRTPDVGEAIRADLAVAEAPGPAKPVLVPSRISDALAEPAPPAVAMRPEPKLDLLVNNAQAREVFLAIVADTRYSMMMHPDVAGTLSVTLRGVTVLEALEAIRDVYGYDFKMEGRRITVYGPTLQTRIFTVNYPHSQRMGNSDLRVSPGAALQSSSTGGTTSGATQPTSSSQQGEGSRVTTTSKTDFWAELRQVDKFLKAAQIAVERQVMLEAKIVEVELRDGYQSGIDWSALKNGGGSTGAMGVIGGNTSATTSSNTLVSGVKPNLPGFSAGAA